MKKLIITLLLMTLSPIGYAAKYKVTDLGVLGGSSGRSSVATYINDSGQIVGFSTFQPSEFTTSLQLLDQAFLYENGVMTGLGTLGGDDSRAHSINDEGVIVGESENSSGVTEAFLYINGSMLGLGTGTYSNSIAKSINENGQIAGYSLEIVVGVDESMLPNDAFIYENGELKTLGIGNSRANSINDGEQIVGELRTTFGLSEAYLFENGEFIRLGALSTSGNSFASSINESGQIVGRATNLSGLDEAFLYENGEMKGLGLLSGFDSSSALSINNGGQIVGFVRNNTLNVNEAFLYENDQFFRLNDLLMDPDSGWALRQANSINGKGQIVGFGVVNDQVRAFLLDPLPEVSIRGVSNIKEGESAQFDVEFETDPIIPVDVTMILGLDNEVTLESPVEPDDVLTIPADTATRNIDYEGAEVYDANGMVLAVVGEGNRFTLSGLQSNTRFFVRIAQEHENNEDTETLTVVLDDVNDGAFVTETLTRQFATVSIEDVPVPEISIESVESVNEGESGRFEITFDIEPSIPVDVTVLLGVDNVLILESPVDSTDTLTILADTASRNVDYDGMNVYDEEGNVLAVVGEDNRFVITGVGSNTAFFVQTNQEFENLEGAEVFTAVLESVSEGAILTGILDNQFSSVNLVEVAVPTISVFSNSSVVEGALSRFDVGFSAPQPIPLDITISLGAAGDTALSGEDFDALQIYDENGIPLTTVAENGDFVLENVSGTTSFYVRTLSDQNHTEGNEFFTVILASYTDGLNLVIPDPQPSARAIIKDPPFEIMVFNNADVFEGQFSQFDIAFSFPPLVPLDLTFELGSIGDSAIPGEDYDAMQIFDENGNVLAVIGENGEFTLENLSGATSFYVKTLTDTDVAEVDEFFTAILESYTDGQGQIFPEPMPAAQATIRNQILDITIKSSSNGIEGYSAKFDLEFNVQPDFPVDVTVALGADGDTATLGIDYERSRIYSAHFSPRTPIATADGNEFTLKGLTGNTSFYVQTFQERITGEGPENFTATLVSFQVGDEVFVPGTVKNAQAGIVELGDPDLITVSTNLDVYIPNFVQISESRDDFFWMTLKHAGGNIWELSGIQSKEHNPNAVFYATAPPNRKITIYTAQLMDLPFGRSIFAELVFIGPDVDGRLQWELIEARVIE